MCPLAFAIKTNEMLMVLIDFNAMEHCVVVVLVVAVVVVVNDCLTETYEKTTVKPMIFQTHS